MIKKNQKSEGTWTRENHEILGGKGLIYRVDGPGAVQHLPVFHRHISMVCRRVYVEGQGHQGGPCGGGHLPFCGLSKRLIRQMDLLNSAKAWRASLDSLSTFLLAFLSLSRLMRKPLISS